MLRDAWKVVRLDAIREAVDQTICELHALHANNPPGRLHVAPDDDAATHGAVLAALDACCDELRDGCGMPVPIRPAHPTNGAWIARYRSALEMYREYAADVLEASIAGPPRVEELT